MKKFAVWSFILILAVFAFTFAPGTASAFDVHTASVSVSTDMDDLNYRPMISGETELFLIENAGMFGTVGADLDMSFYDSDTKDDRITYDMELFVQPRDWLRIGFVQERSWLSMNATSYSLDNRIRLRVGKLF